MQYTIVIDMDGNIRIDRLPLGRGTDRDIIKGSCMYAVFSKFKNCEISPSALIYFYMCLILLA
jgi:hypothetical protein